MGAHTYYTLGQARILLGRIDWKTLNKWLGAAGITPVTDPKDSRIKRLSRKQLHRLASLHGISLSDEDAHDLTMSEPSQSFSSLATDVEQVQQSLEALTSTFDARFEQAALHLDSSLQGGLQEVKQELLSFIREVFRELLSSGSGNSGRPPVTGEERTGRSVLFSEDGPSSSLTRPEKGDAEVL